LDLSQKVAMLISENEKLIHINDDLISELEAMKKV
jgi:hypothetical protein